MRTTPAHLYQKKSRDRLATSRAASGDSQAPSASTPAARRPRSSAWAAAAIAGPLPA